MTPYELAESESSLLQIFGREVYALARSAREAVRRGEGRLPGPPERDRPGEMAITVDPLVHADLLLALIEAARIRKLLWPREHKPDRWSHERWDFHNRRAALLREPLEGMSLDAIRDVSVRNSVEHFDEHLDREVIRIVKGRRGPKSVHVITDAVFSTRGLWKTFASQHDATTVMVRVFIRDERTLVNLGHETNIGRLEADCANIVGALDRFSGGGMSESAEGSGIYVWTPIHLRTG